MLAKWGEGDLRTQLVSAISLLNQCCLQCFDEENQARIKQHLAAWADKTDQTTDRATVESEVVMAVAAMTEDETIMAAADNTKRQQQAVVAFYNVLLTHVRDLGQAQICDDAALEWSWVAWHALRQSHMDDESRTTQQIDHAVRTIVTTPSTHHAADVAGALMKAHEAAQQSWDRYHQLLLPSDAEALLQSLESVRGSLSAVVDADGNVAARHPAAHTEPVESKLAREGLRSHAAFAEPLSYKEQLDSFNVAMELRSFRPRSVAEGTLVFDLRPPGKARKQKKAKQQKQRGEDGGKGRRGKKELQQKRELKAGPLRPSRARFAAARYRKRSFACILHR